MADAGMSEGVLWLSLTVLTGPDIKTSIVKGQPNETIGDLLSGNEFLKGKQILKITGGATANINSASIELNKEMPITLLKGFNIVHFFPPALKILCQIDIKRISILIFLPPILKNLEVCQRNKE